LKNADATLPLHEGAKIAMIGKTCKWTEDTALKQGSVFSGGGSGFVKTNRAISPFAGMQARVPGVVWSADASAGAGVDVAVVCVAAHAEEGWDRKDYVVPEAQDLVSALRQQPGQKKVVVVAAVPGAVTTEWIDQADAALILFMPGEQVGAALAALLTGDAAPGGRLPVSFPKVGESRFTPAQYPGECAPPKTFCPWLTAHFTESVLVGYRWNDAKGVPAAFPFGYGLTYTHFEFSNFEAKCDGGRASVSLNITNAGARDGAAVPQLYVSFRSLRPTLRQLRGFQKVWIPAGEQAPAAFLLGDEDWSFYSEHDKNWTSARQLGEAITIFVGSSSGDLHWNTTLTCS
jgi:beta-glucosidase